jgi:protein TonB
MDACASLLAAGRVKVSSGVMAGQRIKGAMPSFPPMPKKEHLSGATVLHAVIGRDGLVKELTAVSGPAAIRENVMNAVRQWEYKPYILHSQPVEVDTTIVVHISFGG